MATWLLLFVAINHVYFLAVEEPGLEESFGQAYLDYAAHVPRRVPRGTPWPE